MFSGGENAVTDDLPISTVKRNSKKEKNEKDDKNHMKIEARKSEKERKDSKEHSSKHRKSSESEKERIISSEFPLYQIDSSSGHNIANKNISPPLISIQSTDIKNVFEVAAALLTYVPTLWMSFPSDLACKYYDVHQRCKL